MKLKLVILLGTVSLMIGCAPALQSLKNTNRSIASAGNIGGPTDQEVLKALSIPQDKETQKMQEQALNAIREIVQTSACVSRSELMGRRLGIYSSADARIDMSPPMAFLKNHRGGCLDIARIDGFKKLSANSFKFSVLFVSPQSKESIREYFKMIQEPNGEWLLQWYSSLAMF